MGQGKKGNRDKEAVHAQQYKLAVVMEKGTMACEVLAILHCQQVSGTTELNVPHVLPSSPLHS